VSKIIYKYKCVFCGNAISIADRRMNVILCDNCGLSISAQHLSSALSKYNLTLDDVGDEIKTAGKKLVKILLENRVGIGYIAKILAYKHYYERDLKKAFEILKEYQRARSRRKFRTTVYNMFGKKVCMDDCYINLFIEKAVEHGLREDEIVLGIEILREIEKKHALSRTIIAAVFYFVSNFKQVDVARIFGVSDVSIRNTLKKFEEILVEQYEKWLD